MNRLNAVLATVAGVTLTAACGGVDDQELDDLSSSSSSSSTSSSSASSSSSSSSSSSGSTTSSSTTSSTGTGGSDPGCPNGQKDCGGKCVGLDDPATGCAEVSCSPCSLGNATATCDGGKCAIDKCNDGFDDCDNNPSDCESPVSSDAGNCGWCGHDCKGSSCSNGFCQPTTLASGLVNANSIALDGTYAYFTETDTYSLKRVLKSGGNAPKTVYQATDAVYGVALSPTHAYVATGTSGLIRLLKGGGVAKAIDQQFYGSPLVSDATHIYYSEYYKGELRRADFSANPTIEVLAKVSSGLFVGDNLAVDNGFLFWADADTKSVMKVSLSSKAISELAFNINGLYGGVAVAAGQVFFNGLGSVSTNGGNTTKYASALVSAITSHGSDVYWSGANNNISTMTVGSGTERVLVKSENNPGRLAADADYLYYLTNTSLKRVAR